LDTNLKEKQGLRLADLENSIGYLLRRANRMARDVTIPMLAKNGLSPLELSTLYLVNENHDCTLRELSKAVFLEPPATHRLLNGLEKKGLISRRKSKQDARFVHISITPSGHEKVAGSADEIKKIEQTFLGKLDVNQREIFVTILKKLVFGANQF